MKHVKSFENRAPKRGNSDVEKTSNLLEEKWESLQSLAREGMIKFLQKTLKDRENLETITIGSIDDNYGGVSYTYIVLDKREYPLVFIPEVDTAGMSDIEYMLCVLDSTVKNMANVNLEFISDEEIIWQGNDLPWELTKKIRLHRGTDISKKTGIA